MPQGSGKKYALISVVLIVLALIVLTPKTDLLAINSVVADPEVSRYPNSYWTQSTWNKGTGSYDYKFEDGMLTMRVDSDSWGGVGVFQGQKPFGWGESTNVFNPVLVQNNLRVYWRGKPLSFRAVTLQSQTSLGVDFWFEVEGQNERKVAEIYVFFYQQGISSLPNQNFPIGSRRLTTRTEGSYSWQYLMVHYSQLGILEQKLEAFDLSELVTYFKSLSAEPYSNGRYYLTGIDCHLEVYQAEASYTLDYCAVGYPTT